MKVFYQEQMVAPRQGYSPSPSKPKLVVETWQKHFGEKVKVQSFLPASFMELITAHDPKYVRGVLNGDLQNGFGNRDLALSATLPWTVGSLRSAAVYAATTGFNACSPTSGFHHAKYDHADGFCTFNGLIVAARAVRTGVLDPKTERALNIGIIDADMHYGDGTEQIIKHDALVWLKHWTIGGSYRGTTLDADLFMAHLEGNTREFIRRPHKLDLLIYQAGADPHIDDPLGGWLTPEQLYQRDRIVFDQCRKADVPVVWNLAGGYCEPFSKTIEVHVNTMKAALEFE